MAEWGVSWMVGRLAIGSFAISAMLAGVLLVLHPGPVPLAILLALLLVGAGLGRLTTRLQRERRATDWLLSVIVVNLVLVVPELSLRVAGFRYEAGVQFGFPQRIDFTRFAPHEELFWTYPVGRSGVNSWGFRGEEVVSPKPSSVVRIAFLGDSCTDLGEPANYPQLVEQALNSNSRADSVEAVVLAVSGYSSHQGRVIAREYAPRVEPDVAFVYFGWNDHWHARGAVDAEKNIGQASGPVADAVRWAYGSVRVLQAGRWVLDRVWETGTATPPDRVRVPPDDYRANLEAIRDEFAALGVPVVFITAPTTWYRFGVSERLIAAGHIPDARTGIQRHRSYNAIVRQVAGTGAALLLDLEAEFDTLSIIEDVMIEDGIHYSNAGLRFLANRLVTFLLEHDLVDEPQGSTIGG